RECVTRPLIFSASFVTSLKSLNFEGVFAGSVADSGFCSVVAAGVGAVWAAAIRPMAATARNESKPTTLGRLRLKTAIIMVLLCASGAEKRIERNAYPTRSGRDGHPSRCAPSEWPCRRAQ